MPLRGPYAPELPELDPFLFAAVGEEIDGMPLSVLSALAQLGLDPRGEAARLSHLGDEPAADQLAGTIARLPGGRWTSPEMRKIAAGLVELLPRAPMGGSTDEATGGRADRKTATLPSPFLILLTLAGALLIGVAAHGSLSSDRPAASQPAAHVDTAHLGK
jgi:hypothetical protein